MISLTIFCWLETSLCELHLKELGFTYSVCGPLTKHCERIQKFKETGDLKLIYKNELDKPCFARHATYSNSKGLAKITMSDEILKKRGCEIALNPKCDRYQRGLANIGYKFFHKKTGLGVKASVSKELAQDLRKPMMKKLKKRKVYARLKDNILAADIADMGL